MLYRVKGAGLRYNGHRYAEGELVEMPNQAHAKPLLDVGRLEEPDSEPSPGQVLLTTSMTAVAKEALKALADQPGAIVVAEDANLRADLDHANGVLEAILDVVLTVEGVPGHLLLLDAVKWMAGELTTARAELVKLKADKEPPAEAEPEAKPEPEPTPEEGPAPEPEPEREPEPAKPEPEPEPAKKPGAKK